MPVSLAAAMFSAPLTSACKTVPQFEQLKRSPQRKPICKHDEHI